MQAVIQSLEHLVMALATAAFAHFGMTLKDVPCPKPAPAVQRIGYTRAAAPRPLHCAPYRMAKEVRRA
jgi:hypothetical protein